MKIEGFNIIAAKSIASKKNNKTNSGNDLFSELIEGENEVFGAESVKSTNFVMSNFLDDDLSDLEAKKGKDVLNIMEKMRNNLAEGKMEKEQIFELQNMVFSLRSNFVDPKLNNILEEIELRAAVEIAKFNRYHHN